MPIYNFYWGDHEDEQFFMEIDADEETVKRLLDEYRSIDPEEYNNADWEGFLKDNGIEAEILEPIEIYF